MHIELTQNQMRGGEGERERERGGILKGKALVVRTSRTCCLPLSTQQFSALFVSPLSWRFRRKQSTTAVDSFSLALLLSTIIIR